MGVISLFLASSSNTQSFLRKIERSVSGFSGPPRHHVPPSQPQPLPRELLTAEFVFVRDDASKPPLSPLYRGCPRLRPASVIEPPVHVKKKVWFEFPVPATKLRRNPRRTVRGVPPFSAVLRPLLLGGVSVATTTKTTFAASCLQSQARSPQRHLSLQYESS